MQLTNIEKEKYQYIINKKFTKKYDHQLSISIFDVYINLYFKNINHIDFEFLEDYYRYFPASPDPKKIINVYYNCFDDERGQLNHRWYSERLPNTQYIPNTKINGHYTLQRDYFSFHENNLNEVFVFGPRPSEENPDSLDNLITNLFSSCNKHHQNLILHSATVIKDDKAYVFFGESGSGKSTLAFHCFTNFNQRVISSDQTYLSLNENKIFAKSTPITIPEITRHSKMRYWDSIEVVALIHLKQDPHYGLKELNQNVILKKLLSQSYFYLTPSSDQQKYLDLTLKISTLEHILYGELSYEKGSNFWKYF